MKYYLLLIVFFFSNCTAQTHDRVVVSHYDNTHVKKQVFDSLGKLHSEQIFLKDGDNLVEDGYIKIFWPDGTINGLGFFKKGKKDSLAYLYNEKGNVVAKFYLANDSIVGSQYTYFNNGQVSFYTFNLKAGGPTFQLQFDSLGHLEKRSGQSLVEVVYGQKPVYAKEDTVDLNYMIATPENLRTEVVISMIVHGEHTKWITRSKFKPLDLANIFCFENPHYLCSDGPAVYYTVLNMYDTTTNKLLISDTDCYHINVKM